MDFGICLQNIVPVRLEANHRSEMVTQVLFGELYRIIETTNDWLKIKLSYDDYEGWIEGKQHTGLDEDAYISLSNAETPCSLDLVQLISNETKKNVFPIVLGSSLPGIEEFRFSVKDQSYVYDGQVTNVSELEEVETPQEMHDIKQAMIQDAMLFLHAPYLWGGRTPFGIDCSGLIQMIFKLKNIPMLRDAKQQAGQGEVVSLLDEAEPGDVVFFDDHEGNIIHTGLVIDRNRILHASGKVRIDSLDHEGIFNSELQQYTHKLRLIKRIF
jgi:gamma-D-glutamyl-L-lysine dipeptidyl-peptidase